LQRQLARLAPDRKNEARLASLLIDIGEMDEAQAMWLRLSESNTDPELLARNLNRLFAAGEIRTAISLATKAVTRDPDDWETRVRLMVLQADEANWENASKTADELVSMKLSDDTLPVGAKPYKRTVSIRGGQAYKQPPARTMRLQSMYSFYQIVDDRYGYQSATSLPRPMDFGHAKLMALYCQLMWMKLEGENISKLLSDLQEDAMADNASPDQVWKWYETTTIAAAVQQMPGINFQSPADWGPLWRLMELDREQGTTQLVSLFANRMTYALRENMTIQPLPSERLTWLKERSESTEDNDLLSATLGRPGSWA
jgi:tetratricopeptide (TPR) repeat protein